MVTICIRDLTPRERFIEFLNFMQYDQTKLIKDIIEEFKCLRGVDVPRSTGYRVVKQWRDKQRERQSQLLSTRVSDKLIEVFDS